MSHYEFDTVIYHKDCPDGFTAAYAFWVTWADDIEYIPAAYDDPPPDVTGKTVAIVDFSYKRDILTQMAKSAKYIVVLDHHQSAKKELWDLQLDNVDYIFDMSRSGAQIAWDYLYDHCPPVEAWLPYKRPWFIDYVADRDLWLFELPNSRAISEALFYNGYFRDFDKLHSLLHTGDSLVTAEQASQDHKRLVEVGTLLLEYKDREIEYYISTAVPVRFIVGACSYDVRLVGCPGKYRSDIGNIICKTQDCDFAAMYRYNFMTNSWYISLRGSDECPYNLADICSKLGGGGHSRAAGFTINCNTGDTLQTFFQSRI